MAVHKNPWCLKYVPDHLKIEEMYNRIASRKLYTLRHVSDHLKTQEMYNEAVCMSIQPKVCL